MKRAKNWLKKNWLLILILLIAAFLRIYRLGSVPNGFYSDEASIGYNAYTILKTGMDEHGKSWPLFFKAFGEYKNPIYVYATVPFVWLLGLNEFATRLPAAIFGIAAILGIYLVAKKLFGRSIGLIAAFALAISPWHLHFSRIAFEAISFPTFFIFGIYYLLRAVDEKKFYPLAGLLLGLCFYTYAVAKLFVPLFILFFSIICWKKLRQSRWRYLYFLVIVASFLYFTVTYPGINDRFDNEISIMKQEQWQKIFFENYQSYLSKNFLFTSGDNEPRHSVPGFGQLYLTEAATLLFGVIYLIKRFNQKTLFLLGWLLIAFVPASLTKQSPHAIRSLVALPALEIISAAGIFYVFIKNKYFKKILVFLLIMAYLINITCYLNTYYTAYPRTTAGAFLKDYNQMIMFAEKNISQYGQVYFGGNANIFGLQALILFHSKNPAPKNILNQYLLGINKDQIAGLPKNYLFISNEPANRNGGLVLVARDQNNKIVFIAQ